MNKIIIFAIAFTILNVSAAPNHHNVEIFSQRGKVRVFGRVENAPASGGYHYPKPEQGLPEPEPEVPTTTSSVDTSEGRDYEYDATAIPEFEDSDPELEELRATTAKTEAEEIEGEAEQIRELPNPEKLMQYRGAIKYTDTTAESAPPVTEVDETEVVTTEGTTAQEEKSTFAPKPRSEMLQYRTVSLEFFGRQGLAPELLSTQVVIPLEQVEQSTESNIEEITGDDLMTANPEAETVEVNREALEPTPPQGEGRKTVYFFGLPNSYAYQNVVYVTNPNQAVVSEAQPIYYNTVTYPRSFSSQYIVQNW